MARSSVKVSWELLGDLEGIDGLKALPWPDGTMIQFKQDIPQKEMTEYWISHADIEEDVVQVNPSFGRDDKGNVSFDAWNPWQPSDKPIPITFICECGEKFRGEVSEVYEVSCPECGKKFARA